MHAYAYLLCALVLGLWMAHTANAALVFENLSVLANSTLTRDDPVAAMVFASHPAPVLVHADGTVFGSVDGGQSFARVAAGSLAVTVPLDGGLTRLEYAGDIPTWYSQPLAHSISSEAVTTWTFIPENKTFVRATTTKSLHQLTFSGLPQPVMELSMGSGGAVRVTTADQHYVAVVVTWFANATTLSDSTRSPGPPGPCCKNSVLVFTSADGFDWLYTTTLSTPVEVPTSQEGPNEASVTELKDKRLLAVFRVDGGDGTPDHLHTPYMQSFSADGGRTWTKPTVMCPNVLSAKPILATLPSGAVVLSGGRPGLSLWYNADGLALQWQVYDIPTEHNRLVQPEWQFCPQFLNANATLGWAQSSAYTSVLTTGDNVGIVCYNRQGAASGGYHKDVPVNCRTPGSTVFCITFREEIAVPVA